MRLIRRIRLLRAFLFGHAVGEWDLTLPLTKNGECVVRRLTPDGTYEYRPMTSEEQADYIARGAW